MRSTEVDHKEQLCARCAVCVARLN